MTTKQKVEQCGCQYSYQRVDESYYEWIIQYCPLHIAAPNLLEACKIALEVITKAGYDGSIKTDYIRKAVAKAEGR